MFSRFWTTRIGGGAGAVHPRRRASKGHGARCIVCSPCIVAEADRHQPLPPTREIAKSTRRYYSRLVPLCRRDPRTHVLVLLL